MYGRVYAFVQMSGQMSIIEHPGALVGVVVAVANQCPLGSMSNGLAYV